MSQPRMVTNRRKNEYMKRGDVAEPQQLNKPHNDDPAQQASLFRGNKTITHHRPQENSKLLTWPKPQTLNKAPMFLWNDSESKLQTDNSNDSIWQEIDEVRMNSVSISELNPVSPKTRSWQAKQQHWLAVARAYQCCYCRLVEIQQTTQSGFCFSLFADLIESKRKWLGIQIIDNGWRND